MSQTEVTVEEMETHIAMLKMSERSSEQIASYLSDPTSSTQDLECAIEILGSKGNQSHTVPIWQHIGHEELFIRCEVLIALSRLGATKYAQSIATRLQGKLDTKEILLSLCILEHWGHGHLPTSANKFAAEEGLTWMLAQTRQIISQKDSRVSG